MYAAAKPISSETPSELDLAALKKQLTVVQTQCTQAMGMYEQSLHLQEKASKSNLGAVVFERGAEKLMQAKRDKEMQAAIEPAGK